MTRVEHDVHVLSAAGESRRSAMLESLQAEQVHVHRRRRARRRAVTAGACLLAVSGIAFLGHNAATPTGRDETAIAPAHAHAHAHGPAPAPARPTVLAFSTVSTDPTVLERTASATTHSVRFIDDAELVATLHEAGRPTGIIRIGDEVTLTEDVADEG
ncbi:MAG: hypothetical protein ACYTF9_15185 [Planctomycetota bacterium]|jgi:hypothetical protein